MSYVCVCVSSVVRVCVLLYLHGGESASEAPAEPLVLPLLLLRRHQARLHHPLEHPLDIRALRERLLPRHHVARRALQQRGVGHLQLHHRAGEVAGRLLPPLVMPDAHHRAHAVGPHTSRRPAAVLGATLPLPLRPHGGHDGLLEVACRDPIHGRKVVQAAQEVRLRRLDGAVHVGQLAQGLARPRRRAAQHQVGGGPPDGHQVLAQLRRQSAAPHGDGAVVVLQARVLRAAVGVPQHDHAQGRQRGGGGGVGRGRRRAREHGSSDATTPPRHPLACHGRLCRKK
mmetsp:Transcript_18997/g.47358  ORF Transcript_18997/g.47358 Transcript_18997/m.47358 type:complete len:285 (-) Transcript_18997:462-1316(-)